MSFTTRKAKRGLWILQALLAALFLFAGGFKLGLPLATLAQFSPLPAPFIKFVGLCEVTGALGLILPGLLRTNEWLTPLAAAGLTGIMTGAVIVTVATMGLAPTIPPALVGVLALTIVRGRLERATASATPINCATLSDRRDPASRRVAA